MTILTKQQKPLSTMEIYENNMIDIKFNQENEEIINIPTLNLKEKRYAILYKEHKWIVKTVDVECDEVVIKNVNHYKKFDKKINLKNYDKTL